MERYQAIWTRVIESFASKRLIDPEHAPSGRDPAEALRAIVADIGEE